MLAPEERFWARVQPEPNTGCWLWFGSADAHGYGMFSVSGQRWRAHRWSYEHHVGPIPDGLDVCHTCDTPACVNPAHLWIGTASDNAIDAERKGRLVHLGRSRWTHCGNGHLYTEETTLYQSRTGYRICRICRDRWNRARSKTHRTAERAYG